MKSLSINLQTTRLHYIRKKTTIIEEIRSYSSIVFVCVPQLHTDVGQTGLVCEWIDEEMNGGMTRGRTGVFV